MTQQSIFITGAGSGIGAATARVFAAKGWRVALADRDGAAVEALASEIGGAAFTVDVLDRDSIATAMNTFTKEGGLTALFNSAGLLDMHPFAEADPARLDALFDVNVKGVMNAIRAALPALKSAENAHIVTMSSAAAIHGVPDLAAYSASKFAVRGLTEALNIEFEPMGIWVSDLMVGYVATPMLSKADATAKSVELAGVHVTPERVAETVYQATQEQRVHWFVRDEDREAQAVFDATPLEARRDLMRPSTGY
ncbi:SDR family oxidoreductase [Celeribacter sp. SCSIO 80788]|uniref:SDR family oxidoreductase n=1 Tax=Celeribacter sp. SCSIO 80788 TaxID=3117013 RepID=UPI003DA4AF41